MRALRAAELLEVWEWGRPRSMAERALGLLAVAGSGRWDELRRWRLGRCNQRLFELRAATFGAPLTAVADCDRCGESLEITLDCEQMLASGEPDSDAPAELEVDGYRLRIRPATPEDLASLDPRASLEANRHALLERCVLAARRGDRQVAAAELPDSVQAAVSRRLAELDTWADVELDIECRACGARSTPSLDIWSFLWAEVEAWAHRTLDEIDVLARRYGWTESDVLALSAQRRQSYLQLAGR